MRFAAFAVAVLAATALSGCKDAPRGRIHGTVKVQGKPLTDATISFIASDNRSHLANLKADGSFEVSGVALGPVKVSIQQSQSKTAPRQEITAASGSKLGVVDEKAKAQRQEPAASAGNAPRLPKIYADPEKSGLSFELKELDQEWSVDLNVAPQSDEGSRSGVHR